MSSLDERTGIPHEQEMPAPVTITILLLFATDRESSVSDLLVERSEDVISRVAVIAVSTNSGSVRGLSPRGTGADVNKHDL
jgi:hypothetical protein